VQEKDLRSSKSQEAAVGARILRPKGMYINKEINRSKFGLDPIFGLYVKKKPNYINETRIEHHPNMVSKGATEKSRIPKQK